MKIQFGVCDGPQRYAHTKNTFVSSTIAENTNLYGFRVIFISNPLPQSSLYQRFNKWHSRTK